MGSGGGYEAAYGDIKNLQNSWTTEEAAIRSMASRLKAMLSELETAAHDAIKASLAAGSQGGAASSQASAKAQHISGLLTAAQNDVTKAITAVNSLSAQLSEDADKLHQTASTYQLAEIAARDHITSLGQLASYQGPDSSRIHALLNGESPGQQAQTGQQAVNLAFPGAGGAGTGSGSGSADPGSAGSVESAGAGGGEYAGTGSGAGGGSGYSGGGSAAGGSAGGGGFSGGGGGGGVGTPVAPDVAASSAQVDDWVKQAVKELEKAGVPASKIDPNAIKLIIMHESGGNPNAINLTDSNAQAGHPSQGLMQCIPSTFNAYALPGHGNIVNPVDNIIAGTRYALSRYGSLDNVPGVVAVEQGGSYVGY